MSPEQVVGTTFEAACNFDNGVANLRMEPRIASVNDGPGKPVGIHRHIGRVPMVAFGISDGDIAMMEITTNSPESKAGKYPRLAAFVWPADAVREYAYGKDSSVGRLDKGLTLAPQLGWHLIDMKRDWKVVFPFELRYARECSAQAGTCGRLATRQACALAGPFDAALAPPPKQ